MLAVERNKLSKGNKMTNETSEIKQKLYGINDDHDTCAECGKTNLKRVMWIGLNDASVDPAPYGTTCGARLLAVSTTGGSKKVWSNMASKAIEEIFEAYSEFVSNETFNRGGMAVPKSMSVTYRVEVSIGGMSKGDFAAMRNERFPIMRVSNMDVGTMVWSASRKGDWSGINEMLEIANDVPSGLQVKDDPNFNGR